MSKVQSGMGYNYIINLVDYSLGREIMIIDSNITGYTVYTRKELQKIKIELQKDFQDDLRIDGKSISIYSDYDNSIQGFILKDIVLT